MKGFCDLQRMSTRLVTALLLRRNLFRGVFLSTKRFFFMRHQKLSNLRRIGFHLKYSRNVRVLGNATECLLVVYLETLAKIVSRSARKAYQEHRCTD